MAVAGRQGSRPFESGFLLGLYFSGGRMVWNLFSFDLHASRACGRESWRRNDALIVNVVVIVELECTELWRGEIGGLDVDEIFQGHVAGSRIGCGSGGGIAGGEREHIKARMGMSRVRQRRRRN